MNKTLKIIISIIVGLFGTGYAYSFFYFFISGNLTYLFWFGIPVFTALIGYAFYLSIKRE